MKKILVLLLFLLCACIPAAFAQGKTSLVVLGKEKGRISSMQSGGHTLVDAQVLAKKLGGSVEVFSASKQLKIAFPGMYAILSAPLKEVIINAATVSLPTEVTVSGGKIYAPIDFFMLPQVQKALDRNITFSKNTLFVEKNFTLAFEEEREPTAYTSLHLWRAQGVTFSATQKNAHTVQVVFPNTILKRIVNQRPKTPYVRSFMLSQRGKDSVLEVILGKQGSVWNLEESANKLVLVVSQKPVSVSKTAVDEEVDRADEANETADLTPSIVPENDDAEELDLMVSHTEEQPTVMTAAPAPVISAAPLPVMTAKHNIRIMVDPGHGGKDPGASRRGSSREKDLNLAVAKHLYNYLKKQGFDVKLTRDNDTFVTLAGRSKMANEFKADLFISVHTNAAKRTQANGFEVYFRSEKPTDKDAADIAAFENEALQYEETHYSFVDKLLQSLAKNEYMNESSKLASHVRNYVYKEPGIGIAVNQNNAVKQANFYVLRGVQAPAILVEMGYISSPKDRARLNNKSAQKRMGEGIGKGVVVYLKQEGRIK